MLEVTDVSEDSSFFDQLQPGDQILRLNETAPDAGQSPEQAVLDAVDDDSFVRMLISRSGQTYSYSARR